MNLLRQAIDGGIVSVYDSTTRAPETPSEIKQLTLEKLADYSVEMGDYQVEFSAEMPRAYIVSKDGETLFRSNVLDEALEAHPEDTGLAAIACAFLNIWNYEIDHDLLPPYEG